MKPHIRQFATETFGCVIRKVSHLPVLRDTYPYDDDGDGDGDHG